MKAALRIYIFMLLPLLSSCAVDEITVQGVGTPTTVEFTLDVKTLVATKAGEADLAGIDPSSLKVFAYDNSGTFLAELPLLKTSESVDDLGQSKVNFLCAFTPLLPSNAGPANAPVYRFMVIANCTSKEYGLSYDQNSAPNLERLDYEVSYPFRNPIPMWGVKTHVFQYDGQGEPLQTQDLGVIDVLRAAAKIGVKLSPELMEEGYSIEDIKINYLNNMGYSIPAQWNTKAATAELNNAEGFRPAGQPLLANVSAFSTTAEGQKLIYAPETENNPDGELSMSLVLRKGEDLFEFPYEKGIKFRTYSGGDPTEEMFDIVRNHFYDYTVTQVNTTIKLELIEYDTLPWENVNVNAGGQTMFLVLNKEVVEIYGENVDATSLKFTSSSPIRSIVLKDVYGHDRNGNITAYPDGTAEDAMDGMSAYYVTKYGVLTQLGTDPGFDLTDKDAELAREQVVLENISAVAEPNKLAGGITITSPFMADETSSIAALKTDSHFDTVRYLEFEVTNEQGLTETFRVEQYPPTIITHIEGFHSYRDDFRRTDDEEPAHYQNYMGPGSISCFALSLVHDHDWTKEALQPESFWQTRQTDRNYSFLLGSEEEYSWLDHGDNGCPSQGKLGEHWEEMRYSTTAYNVTFISQLAPNIGKELTNIYGGGYRPITPPTDYFTRSRYYKLPGAAEAKNEAQGNAIGGYYERDVTLPDGTVETRVFRKHFTWNVQSVFWSRYVAGVFQEDGANANGRKRLKGHADICQLADASEPGYVPTEFAIYSRPRLYRNHRMYHIKMTSSSENYSLGYPTLVDESGMPTTDTDRGSVENTSRNARLVSPSFQLASELGATDYNYIIANCEYYGYVMPGLSDFYKLAERHCREYVETSYEDLNGNMQYDDGEPVTHYHDWRLPSKAEIEMLIDYQTNSRAMDRVLLGEHFVCITGQQPAAGATDINDEKYWVSSEVPGYVISAEEDLDGIASTYTGYYIRCVRDVKN